RSFLTARARRTRPRVPPRRLLRTRSRSPRGPSSRVAELVEPVLVDPEVVRELVEDGDPDLSLELLRIGERLLERKPVDRHLRRQVGLALEQAEEVGIVMVLVLHDHCDVLETRAKAPRERVERVPDVLLERQ